MLFEYVEDAVKVATPWNRVAAIASKALPDGDEVCSVVLSDGAVVMVRDRTYERLTAEWRSALNPPYTNLIAISEDGEAFENIRSLIASGTVVG